MKWNHLPIEGGIYAQDPQLLDEWRYIFAERGEHDRKQREADARKNKTPSKGGRKGGGPQGSRSW